MTERTEELLVILLDIHPVWWADHSLTEVLQSVLVLTNAHLLQSPLNKLCVYGYLNTGVYKLYPSPDTMVLGDSSSGKFEGFDVVNTTIAMRVKDIILDCVDPEEHRRMDGSLLSGALIKALCFSNKEQKSVAIGSELKSRILVIKGSPDCQSQYMPIMNSIFAAQKSKVAIDGCVLGEDSTFLQQASEISGGSYMRVADHATLTQVLLSVFLMGVEFRKSFNIPAADKVDFRAACQCHSKLIDIGYVCSVCMSVYCSFRPNCMTCSAHFKLPAALLRAKKGTGKRKAENGNKGTS